MKEKLRKIPAWIRYNRTDVLVTIVWTVIVALILFKAYWLFYFDYLAKTGYANSWYLGWEKPSLAGIDLVLLLASSFIAGIILSDAPQMVYGYLISMFFSSSLTILFIFLYRWFTQASWIALIPYGWEYLLYYIFLNIFWMMLPMGLLCCFLGVLIGGFLKHYFLI